MIEKVCSGIFMSLHVRGLHFAISVHTRLGPCALCCGMSEQPARTCSIPQLTCGVPGELQQAGNTGKMTWAGRILANWVHSRILFLAAWCPLCGLCKILFRPSPGWSHLTSEPHPLGALHVAAVPTGCLSQARHPPRLHTALLALPKLPLPPCRLLSFFKTEVKSYFLLEALSDFRMQGWLLPTPMLPHTHAYSLSTFSFITFIKLLCSYRIPSLACVSLQKTGAITNQTLYLIRLMQNLNSGDSVKVRWMTF